MVCLCAVEQRCSEGCICSYLQMEQHYAGMSSLVPDADRPSSPVVSRAPTPVSPSGSSPGSPSTSHSFSSSVPVLSPCSSPEFSSSPSHPTPEEEHRLLATHEPMESSSEFGLFGHGPEPEWARNLRLIMERREPFDTWGQKRTWDNFYLESMMEDLLGKSPGESFCPSPECDFSLPH